MITRFYTGVTTMIVLMVISNQILIMWKLLPFALQRQRQSTVTLK